MTSFLPTTEALLALVPQYGVWFLGLVTFLSCLALPVPSSILMLAAGGFTATGDLGLASVTGAALAGAVLGDQAGFALGRFGGAALLGRIETAPARAATLARARGFLAARGDIAVFLTRWLFSAIGPWINLIAGGAGHGWWRFTFWGVLGEAVWVGIYVGVGRAFADNLAAAGDMVTSVLGLLAGIAVLIGTGWWLLRALRGRQG